MMFSAYEGHGLCLMKYTPITHITLHDEVFFIRSRNTNLKERSTNENNLMTGQGWHQKW